MPFRSSTMPPQSRFRYCGPNQMKPPPKVPEWKKFLKEMTGPFNLLLWSAGILCFIAYGLDNSVADNVGCPSNLPLVQQSPADNQWH